MCPRTALQDEPHVRTVEGTEGRGNTEQGREPLKAPSRWEQAASIEESKVVRNVCLFGSMQVKTRGGGKVVHESMEQEGEQSRVRQIPMSMEDSRDGCHCSRCGSQSYGSSSREHAFSKSLMEDPDEQGEAWFNQENSAAERHSMLRLERELEVALAFEHSDGEDSGPKVQPVWIMHILLGRLFKERQLLRRAVKMYAQFQRREFMRSLVKINNLEEQVELPLSDEVRASSSATYRGDAMDIEEQAGMWDEARLAHQLNPGDGHAETKMSFG